MIGWSRMNKWIHDITAKEMLLDVNVSPKKRNDGIVSGLN